MLFYLRIVACTILRIQMLLEPKSPRCNLHGAFDPCGTCKCEPDFYGEACECEANYRIPDAETALAACSGSSAGEPCNGRGECKCGYCECFSRGSNITERYYGQYCECDDFTCPKYEDKLCGGHGFCSCGKCVCNTGYNGNACETMSSAGERSRYLFGADAGRKRKNPCKMAFSCEQCFDTSSSCGWYKHMDLPYGVKSHCDLYNNLLSFGISEDDILTSESTPNITIVEEQSDECGGQGSVDSCGQCKCEQGYYGKRCECDTNVKMTPEEALKLCIRPGSTRGHVCSRRGECICGACYCFPRRANSMERYTGQYCECDDYSCSFHNNQLCGGHGKCVCGKCECDPGFAGEACDCTADTSTCVSNNGMLCNGHGNCVCGQCMCEQEYEGQTCEECAIMEYQSKKCNFRGSLNFCGDCVCDEGTFGKECECEDSLGMTSEEVMLQCISPNSTVKIMCSGRGECICGFCHCFQVRPQSTQVNYGRFCECNDLSCTYHNNQICGGHGNCSCGQCLCEPGYTGEACDCPIAHDTCISSNGKLCNGHGNCVCGQCACEQGYKGPMCDVCPIMEHQSERCNYRGSMNFCGYCVCNEGTYGRECECDDTPGMTQEEVTLQCIRPNSTVDIMCSGRGECICGFCRCFPIRPQSLHLYNGRFCECNDFSCAYHNNELCGGHGRCSCGQCICEPSYTGEACDCPVGLDACMSSNGKICNGVGNCVCGKCVCEKDSYFRGPTCEECPTCPGVCYTYKGCVLCELGSEDYTDKYCTTYCQREVPNIEIVDSLSLDEDIGGNTPKLCRYTDDDGNPFRFTYIYDEFNQIHIKVQRRDSMK